MPLVTVILPVYNTEKYIAEAVQSILDQTFKDFELLVINDASTDRTLEILESFKDERLRIIQNPVNLKLVKSLNKGLEQARGEFIARMDADDISLPDRLERQLQYFKANPDIDVCGTWVHAFGNDDFIFYPYEKHDDIKANLLFLNIIIHPSVMYKKSSLQKYGLRYDEAYINAEDYGFWAEGIDKLRFANIPEILLNYRLHPHNRSGIQNEIPEVLKEMNYLAYKKIFQKIGLSYEEQHLEMQLKLALRMVEHLTPGEFRAYLKWLRHIVASNNKSNFCDKTSLRNVILHEWIYLLKKSAKTPSVLVAAFTSLIKLYSINHYVQFLIYRRDRMEKTAIQKNKLTPSYN